jgi:hypothetical protein
MRQEIPVSILNLPYLYRDFFPSLKCEGILHTPNTGPNISNIQFEVKGKGKFLPLEQATKTQKGEEV